ncbi:histidine kinase [Edaphobacter aggregans]|uniref:histidine kinase n=1 Tax=Edaphobacter aggregans TaxID=570835 RepID=UPI0014707759
MALAASASSVRDDTDARVDERTRIARDLHDTLLQSFHGVLLRLQTVSQLMREPPGGSARRAGKHDRRGC